MAIKKDFLFDCGLKSRISFQEILGLALPIVIKNIPGENTTGISETEKAVKRAFANKHFSNPDDLDYHAEWFIDTAYAVSLNFLRTGYVQLGKFCEFLDDVYEFTDAVEWDLFTPLGVDNIYDYTFGNQMSAFYAISAHRVQKKLKNFGWTDGQSISIRNFQVKHARNDMVDECVKHTAKYLPRYATYCGVMSNNNSATTNMFAGNVGVQGDLEIPTESLFNSVDIEELEACCFLYEIRHMFDGCFACCAYLREFNFSRFAHTDDYEVPEENGGLIGVSLNNFFYNCINLQLLSGTLPSPTDISYMCSGCISLEQVLVNFDIPKYNKVLTASALDGLTIHYAVGAFANCIHLKKFTVGYAIWMRIKNASYMFENCLSLPFVDLKFMDYLQPLKNNDEQYYCNVHEFKDVPEISNTSDFSVILNNRSEHVNIKTSLPSGDVFSSEIKVHIGALFADSYAVRSSHVISVANSTAVELEYRCGKMFRNCLNLQYINIATGLKPENIVVSDDKSFAFEGCLSFVGFIVSGTNTRDYFFEKFSGDYISDQTIDPMYYNFNTVPNRVEGWLDIMTARMSISGYSFLSKDPTPDYSIFEHSNIRLKFPSEVCKPYVKYNVFKNYFMRHKAVSKYTPFILENWNEFYKVWRINIELDKTGFLEECLKDCLAKLDKSDS